MRNMLEGHYAALIDYMRVLTEQAYERLSRNNPRSLQAVQEEQNAFLAALETKRERSYQNTRSQLPHQLKHACTPLTMHQNTYIHTHKAPTYTPT